MGQIKTSISIEENISSAFKAMNTVVNSTLDTFRSFDNAINETPTMSNANEFILNDMNNASNNVTNSLRDMNNAINEVDNIHSNNINTLNEMGNAVENVREKSNGLSDVFKNLDTNYLNSVLNDGLTVQEHMMQGYQKAIEKENEIKDSVKNIAIAGNETISTIDNLNNAINSIGNINNSNINKSTGMNVTTDTVTNKVNVPEISDKNINILNSINVATDNVINKTEQLSNKYNNLGTIDNKNVNTLNEINHATENVIDRTEKLSNAYNNLNPINNETTAWNNIATQIDSILNSAQHLNTVINQLQSEMQGLSNNRISNIGTEQTNTQIGTLDRIVNNTNTSLNTMNSNIGNINGNIHTLDTSLNSANTLLNSMRQSLDNVTNGINTLNNSMSGVSQNFANANRNMNGFGATIRTINQNIVGANNNINNANARVGPLNRNIVTINNTTTSANGMLRRINQTIVNVNRNVTSTNNTLRNMGQTFANANNNIISANNALRNINTNITSSNNTLRNMNQSLNDINNNSNLTNTALNTMIQTMRDLNNGINTVTTSLNNINNSINNLGNSSNSTNKSTGSLLKTLLGFGAIQSILNMITSKVDSAIDRIDTLSGYTSVMSNLGIGAEEAEASMNRLSEGLKGLPTTLSNAVLSVERFTSANRNIGASTEMFLALNNAILAGGAGTEIQATAMEQLSQAFAKGKPDMLEWRSALTAMPAQMEQIATAMGFVSSAELGESLRTGETSMNEFMKTIVQLNHEGIEGFQSFEEQAKNTTGGLRTTIANMNSAITRGVTSLINEVNAGLENAGLGSIQENIANFGVAIENTLNKVGKGISLIMKMLSPIVNLIKSMGEFVADNWSVISPIIGGIVGALLIYKGVQIALNIATWAGGVAQGYYALMSSIAGAKTMLASGATLQATAAQWGLNAALLACPITWIVLGLILVIAIIYAVVAAINKVTGSSISATGIILGALTTTGAFIWNLFLGLLDLGLGIINALVNPLIVFANFLANLFNDPVASIIHLFGDMADQILRIIQSIASALDKVFGSNLAGAVQGWRNGVSAKVEVAANKYGNGSYEKVANELNLNAESLGLKRWEYSDAWSKGTSAGEFIDDKIGNMFKINEESKPKLEDYEWPDIANNISDTANNTGKIADNMDITEEELKYLRDLAEQEVINRFTTAEIHVEMNNNNNISKEADIDGIISELEEKIEDMVDSMAEGVHK